jgi:hypothetical protein
LLVMLFKCSVQRSFLSKVIPRSFTFLDQRINWLNNVNSDRCLCEHQMRSIAIILSRLMQNLHFVNQKLRTSLNSLHDLKKCSGSKWDCRLLVVRSFLSV